MPSPANTAELLDLIQKSGIVRPEALAPVLPLLPADPKKASAILITRKLLTEFQARMLLIGRYRGFKLGPYIMTALLGRGGMGAVYKAEHEILRKPVAVKVLTDNSDPLTRERFHREARAAAALDHPNIVRTHDVGKDDEVNFLVMDYVEGQTLDRVVEKSGPLTVGAAADAVAQAADGLQHAYEQGFLHRDIKPANLIRTADGTVKILDLGLARSTDKSDELTAHLDKGAIVGTADYISPEQVLNDPNIDIRSDIYSLGATLFALLVGRPLFSGSTVSKLAQHQLKAPKLDDLDNVVPAGLIAVVGKMLAKRPKDRYQTPAEVADALEPWRTNHGPVPKSRPRLASAPKRSRPKWPIWVAAGVLLAAGVGLALAFALPSKPDPVAVNPPNPNPNPGPNPNPNPPNPNPVPVKGETLFRLDFAKLKAYRTESSGAGAGLLPDQTGLPAGAGFQAYGKDGKGEFAAEEKDGRTVLSVANLSARKTAQYYFQFEDGSGWSLGLKLVEGRKYALHVEYATDPGATATVAVQNPRYQFVAQLPLADTNGEWKSAVLPFERGAEPLRATLDATAFDADKPARVYFRAFELVAVGTGAPVKPPTPPGALFRLDFAKLKPFKQVKAVADAGLPPEKTGLPAGVGFLAYAKGAKGEFAAVEKDGGLVLAAANVTAEKSAQYFFQLEDATGLALELAEGKTYTLTIEYATDPGGAASAAIQTGKFTTVKHVGLPDTKGEWKTATLTFERGAEPLRATFDNAAFADDPPLRVYLRRFELTAER